MLNRAALHHLRGNLHATFIPSVRQLGDAIYGSCTEAP